MSDLPPGFVLDQQAPPSSPPDGFVVDHPSLWQDVAKSAGIGVAKGAIGLAGSFGDIGHLFGYARDKYIANPINRALGLKEADLDQPDPALKIGSRSIQDAIESQTGKFYEPQTIPGQYAQTMGEFVPSLIGGGEGLIPKFATRVLAPAVASETAGQLTKGTAAEPYARIAAAIAGGAGARVAMAPRQAVAAPTAEQLGAAAKGAYEHPDVKALELHPSSTGYTADKIVDGLNNDGFRKLTAPQTYSLVEELKSPLGATAKIADVQSVRTALGKVGGNFSNPIEQAAAQKAIRGIDDYLSDLKPYDVAAGDASKAAALLGEAKGNYAASKRMTRIDDAEYRAELNAASAHSGGNINNATRQALKSVLISPAKRRGFSEDELAQMEKIVKGTFTGNAARIVGKLLATTGMHGAGVTAGSIAAAPATGGASLALPFAGYTAKRIADASTARAIRDLDRMVAMRSPLGQSLPKPPQQSKMLLALPPYAARLFANPQPAPMQPIGQPDRQAR